MIHLGPASGSRILIVLMLSAPLLLTACCGNKMKNSLPATAFGYTAGEYEGNYVWGAAMNLAWNELSENIIKEKIALDTDDPEALATLNKLNNPVASKADIDEPSYYVKSGYGQETVSTINRECRAKFPTKSIPDLKMVLGDTDILSYAYFLKEIVYQTEFMKSEMRFGDEYVKGFNADGNSYENIVILDYQSADKFLVAIQLKDNSDMIFLAKGYPMENPEALLKELQNAAPKGKNLNELGQTMNRKDIFQAPVISLASERSYKEMLGKNLKNKKFKQYAISTMKEIVKFDMDEKGARVENEAVIGMITSAGPDVYKPKTMIMDKPYWIVMKRRASDNPYFILGVNNPAVMKLVR